MRIATLQFAPQVGHLDSNIRKAEDLLKQLELKLQKDNDARSASAQPAGSSLDLLVLPEMALTGKLP